MRRAAWVTVCVCVMSTGARTASAGPVTLGIKGGVIAARIEVSGAGSFETSPHAGLAIGGSAAIAIGPTLRIQPELLFTEPRFGSSDFPLPLTVESRAFEVPVLLVKQFSTTRRTRPIVYAGPRFGFITSIAQTVGQTRSDISNEFRSVEVGVALGGGVEITAGRGVVTIEGRTNIGIRDVSKATDNTTRTRSIVGLLGVRF
jgi:hypothetical protein